MIRKQMSDEELQGYGFDEIVENPYSTAEQLHMGSCDLFALALHEEFGYEMFRVDYQNSFHMFCRTEKDGKTIFIDASGMSENVHDLQPGKHFNIEDAYSVENLVFEDGWDEVGIRFARCFIHRFSEYYDVDQLTQEP